MLRPYRMIKQLDPERAKMLMTKAQAVTNSHYKLYQQLAAIGSKEK